MVRKSARFLAPIALVAVAVGIYLTVHSTLRHHGLSSPGTSTTTSSLVHGRHHAQHHGRHAHRFYRVKAGDTLSGISNRLGVSVKRLETLNPRLSTAPNSLATGQRLRLRR
ncbi:MAG: LysM peptidoglycan-binding domain-containing protein [Solirubrobacteraceae bacterium]